MRSMAGRLQKFVVQGLAGLAIVALFLVGISFLVGVLRWAVSVALLLALGYVAWRILNAVFK
jgi:hypothetical protein